MLDTGNFISCVYFCGTRVQVLYKMYSPGRMEVEAGDHWECDAATRAALTSDNVETIEACIRDTGDLEQLLLAAAESGGITAARIILGRTAGTEKPGKSGQGEDTVGDSALHSAARSPSASSPAMLELLLAHRPHLLETRNKEGRTPLHEAAAGE